MKRSIQTENVMTRGPTKLRRDHEGTKPSLRTGSPPSSAVDRLSVSLYHRRGSVLVMVMALLGILFVTGIAFMASMDFEADLIAADQIFTNKKAEVQGVLDPFTSTLRDTLSVGQNTAFSGGFPNIGAPGLQKAFAELPGYSSLISPLEPYENAAGFIVYPWVTDPLRLSIEPADLKGDDPAFNVQFEVINNSSVLRNNIFNGKRVFSPISAAGDFPTTFQVVDADGDGMIDSIQTDLERLGNSRNSLRTLAKRLNPESNPNGSAYVGLRVIPHGAMANLNDSHPNLIATAMGFDCPNFFSGKTCTEFLQLNVTGDPDLGTFRHGPSIPDDGDPGNGPDAYIYPAGQEEPNLRRRFFLPPMEITPSLLHGNSLLNPQINTFGQSDLSRVIFAPTESVFNGFHRNIPIAQTDFLVPTAPDSPKLFAARLIPEIGLDFVNFDSMFNPNGQAYDRRHLLTTISHDANLSRGGSELASDSHGNITAQDLTDLMRETNFNTRAVNNAFSCGNLPFEYPNYPSYNPDRTLNLSPRLVDKTIPNPLGDTCECPTQEKLCRFDPRKGRMKLSLPWLDDLNDQIQAAVAANNIPLVNFLRKQFERIIHDAFYLLVRNATGPYWDDIDCGLSGTNGICPTEHGVMLACLPIRGEQLCGDPLLGQSRRLMQISRTAASLTANMIDFMDIDDPNPLDNIVEDLHTPTRIKLRSFDFNDLRCIGGSMSGTLCDTLTLKLGDTCPGNGTCGSTAGWEFGDPVGPLSTAPVQYVYGLERQPYITEVTTVTNSGVIQAWAVELFNPYDEPISTTGGDTYWLYEVDPSVTDPMVNAKRIQLTGDIRDDQNGTIPPFTVYFSDNFINSFGPNFSQTPNTYDITMNVPTFKFTNGQVLYLVLRHTYPGDLIPTEIVLDQFTVGNSSLVVANNVGAPAPPAGVTVAGKGIYTLERVVAGPDTRWTGVVHLPQEGPEGPHSLGNWNGAINTANIRPVEVQFANTGSFTRLHPSDVILIPPAVPQFGRAFPTTGSMLLLMRHANRATTDYPTTAQLGFTAWLDDSMPVRVLNAVGLEVPILVTEHTQIDNGRLPVFDVGVLLDATNPNSRRVFAHHSDSAKAGVSPPNQPGPLSTLPFGQLVFDYFTALPLSNAGPYADNSTPVAPDAQPRVDLDGLRVHGRININAAPWTVLSGLPLIPMQNIPIKFRAKIRWGAGLVDPNAIDILNPFSTALAVPDTEADTLGPEKAQAIVAYREQRELNFSIGTTGDYADAQGRPWVNTATMRRGMGFLSVGELANVRHPNATLPTVNDNQFSSHRMDFGQVGLKDIITSRTLEDYVQAVALLVTLGDWVTTRSDVFTTYGILRGDEDRSIENPNPLTQELLRQQDIDTRAIRFQETVDRLPTFMNNAPPARIGERVVTPYVDSRAD